MTWQQEGPPNQGPQPGPYGQQPPGPYGPPTPGPYVADPTVAGPTVPSGAPQQPYFQQMPPLQYPQPPQPFQPYQPPPPAGPPKKRGNGLIAAAVGVAVLAAACGAGAVWLVKHNDKAKPVAISKPTPKGPVITPTAVAPTPSLPPAAAGWKHAAWPTGYYYDVPSEWTVLPSTAEVTFDTPYKDPKVMFPPMVGEFSELKVPGSDHCSLAFIGATSTTGKEKPVDAAKEKATFFANAMYTSPKGKRPQLNFGQPRFVTFGPSDAVDLQLDAVTSEALGDQCKTPKGDHELMHALAVDNGKDCIVFIVDGTQGVSGAASPDMLKQIVDSAKPLPKTTSS